MDICTDPVAYGAEHFPHAVACHDLATSRTWTYSDLDRDVTATAAHLADEGVQAGDRVAALALNSVYMVILHHALMKLGAIFVPLNWRLSSPELAGLLQDCSPVILYTEHAQKDGRTTCAPTPALPAGCRSLDMQTLTARLPDAKPPPPAPQHSSPDAIGAILYTSGTSGRPKGVALTRRNMAATGLNFAALGGVDAASVLLCDAPLFHVMGLVVSVWAPLLAGGRLAVSPRFDPAATNGRLAAGVGGGGGSRLVTHYFCVPQMADALARAPGFAPGRWTGLKALFTGGAPNPAARVRRWLGGAGVVMADGYGATEVGTALGMPASAAAVAARAGSVGLPGPLARVEVVDGAGRPVAAGEAGEVVVAGPSVAPGYWAPGQRGRGPPVLLPLNGDEAVAPAVRGVDCRDGDGADGPWFRTGDVARRDEDGFVYLVDRRKDVFISGGENVYPAEVEAALAAHPAVAEAAVIGVPDARWGEVGRAYVVLLAQGEADACSGARLAEHCRGLIGRYKVPKQFRFVHGLPRTGSGKVMKHVLRTEAALEADGGHMAERGGGGGGGGGSSAALA